MDRNNEFQPEPDPLVSLAGGGELGELTRAFDWAKTSLGPVGGWPQALKTMVRVMLESRYAMWLGWGPDLTFFYNDAYGRMTLGPKHPWALGRPAREVWSEIWGDIGPRAESVVGTGRATWDEGLLLFLERRGFSEETYHTFSYSPIPDDMGGIGGMLCVVTEDTERTIGERRLRTLRELAARTADEPKSVEEACQTAARTLADNPHDVPFALFYLADAEGQRLTLAGSIGLARATPASPVVVDIQDGKGPWPFLQAVTTGRAVEVDDLAGRFGPLPGGAWPEPSRRAVVLPMARPGQAQLAGFVVAGVSPRRPLDDGYRGFLDLLAGQVATAIANARAYEEERSRAERLAELDRAKIAFFSNVSHEFRTPLTLMLGPVEDILAKPEGGMPPEDRALLEVVNRNGLRLLRLVNTLLDFSRIEAGRVRASYQPTDLAALTADLASVFRSACERAGLGLAVDCPPLAEPVFVDREMWEKVVLNLLSNAFKFTFEGEIVVTLRQAGRSVELRVKDTGTGIPTDEMPRLFERFHRVEDARGRTHEGSGIGLSLVQEVVRLHAGTVAAESVVGRGTTFVVTIPLGSDHLPPERISEGRSIASTASLAGPFVEEAMRWLPDVGRGDESRSEWLDYDEMLPTPDLRETRADAEVRPRILLADDNADMRQYVARLLSDHFRVDAVADGEAALASAVRSCPDLILTDVMMPKLDGFGLLRALRSDSRTSGVPILMLSARAGEESRVEGMEAGADDYLVKPFGARELLARVSAHLQMASMRKQASESLREGEERLRRALTAARMVAWQWNPSDGSLRVSENAADVFGLPEGTQLVGIAQGLALLHPDDIEGYRETFTRTIEERGSYLTHYRLVRPDDGRVLWMEERGHAVCDESGEVVKLTGVVMDITEAKRAEADLRASEERRRLALDSAELGAWNIDPATNALKTDERFRMIFQGCADPIGFEQAFAAIHPDDRERIRASVAAAMRPEDPAPYAEEFRVVHQDGTIRWVFGKGRANFEPTGTGRRLVSLDGTVADITDRQRGEQERERLVGQLREQDQRKDDFLATLAHELRNPLAPLRNGLQIMKLAADDPRAVVEARALMERQVTHMVRLIDDLMDVSRITRGKMELRPERIELSTIVRNAVETSRPLVEEAGHELSVTLPTRPIIVDADVTRLAQVFSNLLNNAAKYTERGGDIALVVERQGSDVMVSVRDNGIGIPPEMLPEVFDMFTQVDRSLERSRGGLGIGLSLVKTLVEMHGGSVEARSEGEGLGSEFVVRLPVVLAASAQPELPEADRRTNGLTKALRILVVDDNIDSARTLARLLRLLGHETRMAHDGGEAVETAEQYRPELVLLDIGLPVMNGYEVARAIRGRDWGREVAIVALTGWGQEDDRRRSKEAGIDDHLVKPVDPATLERLLSELRTAST